LREIFGEPPIDDHCLPELADEYVVRLEVTVDDPLAVSIGDGLGCCEYVTKQREALREPLALFDQLGEGAAGDELHGIERLATRPAPGLIDGYDGRVLKPGRDERLADEALFGGFVLLEQLLDGNRPVEEQVSRPEDAAIASLGKYAAHGVVLRV